MSRKFNKTLTAERLRRVLSYDASNGEFRTKTRADHSRGGDMRPVGTRAGTVDAKGYRRIRVDGRKYQANRLAWLYVHGVWPNIFIDHKNGDPSDDSIENLREATNSENLQNRVRPCKRNSSKLLGVSTRPKEGRFVASIRLNGKAKYLGYFTTAEAAHQAYLEAKALSHPFAPFGGKSLTEYVKAAQ